MRQHFEEFSVGDRVRVSDGNPQPPKHHTRKLAAWKSRNFTGTVCEVSKPFTFPNGRVSNPNGGIAVSDDSVDGGEFIVFQRSFDLGGRLTVEKIGEEVAA